MSATPSFNPEPEPQITNMANDEATKIAQRQLKRDDSKRTHLHYGGLAIFYVSMLILLSMLVVWAVDTLTPERFHFLSPQGQDKLQTILVSILGSSFASSAARRWIGDPDETKPKH